MNRRVFIILWVLSLVGVITVLPYYFSLLDLPLDKLPAPLPVIIALTLIQNGILLTGAIYAGLRLAPSVDLHTPLLDQLVKRESPMDWLKNNALISVIIGVGAAVVILGLDILLFAKFMPQSFKEITEPPAWQGLLASLYGGVVEEVLMRLFFMTLLIWLASKIMRHVGPQSTPITIGAIVFAAILFGAGHLPAMAQLLPLTPWVIVRTVLLNSIGGWGYGYLYWKKGLEAAMIAHFSTDLILHVFTPLVTR